MPHARRELAVVRIHMAILANQVREVIGNRFVRARDLSGLVAFRAGSGDVAAS